jgi:peptide chain release factor subunit 1
MERSGLAVGWQIVRRLAEHRGDPVVSSVYLDVDGAHRPVAATYQVAFDQLAADLHHRARSRQDARIVHSVDGDIRRMRAWLADGVDRTAVRGLAMFGCSEQDYFEAVELPHAVRDEASLGARPRIRQLVELLDEPEPFLVALVDKQSLRLLEVDGHRVDEHPPLVAPDARAIDTTGELGSFQHHDEEVALIFARRAAGAVEEALRRHPVGQLVLGGPDEAVANLHRFLHTTTRDLVIGRAQVRVAARPEEIAAAARAVADRAERQREADLVEEMRQRAAGAHGAVVGLGATLDALTAQRVATLLVRDGYSAPGGVCPACGHVGPDIRQCAVCGTTNVEVDDVVELAIESAVAQGAAIELCHDTELDRLGSIAAIERF